MSSLATMIIECLKFWCPRLAKYREAEGFILYFFNETNTLVLVSNWRRDDFSVKASYVRLLAEDLVKRLLNGSLLGSLTVD